MEGVADRENVAPLHSEDWCIHNEQLQRTLNAEKIKVKEQRSTLQAKRRALATELADARRQALWSLQLEQKSVYDLIHHAAEVQRGPEHAAPQPAVALTSTSAASPCCQNVLGQRAHLGSGSADGESPARPCITRDCSQRAYILEDCEPSTPPLDFQMNAMQQATVCSTAVDRPASPAERDLEAGSWFGCQAVLESTASAHLDTRSELFSAVLQDLPHGVLRDEGHLGFRSPSPPKYPVKDLEFFSPAPPLSPLVLTSGLARRLMQELKSVAKQKEASAVLENFGLGTGADAQMQVEEALRPHLDGDLRLRQQWLEVVWT